MTPPEERAAAFGRIGAAFGLGFIFGPAIGGLVGEMWGPRAPFFVAGGLAFANVIFGYFVLPESLPPERRRAFDIKRANPIGTLMALKKYPMVVALVLAVFLWQTAHNVYPSTWSFWVEFGNVVTSFRNAPPGSPGGSVSTHDAPTRESPSQTLA